MNNPSYYIEGLLTQGNAALARAYLGVGSGGGIPEAPIDGHPYARENANLVVVPASGVPEAPVDGQAYARKNATWVPISSLPVSVWSDRVVSNGGAAPSNATMSAMSNFYSGLVSAGLLPLMKSVCCFVPDNLIASITPLINAFGTSLWANHNFVLADLTINGLIGDGTTKYLDTGIIPSQAFASDSSGGITSYISVAENAGTNIDIGALNGSNNFQLVPCYGGSCYWDCFNGTAGQGRINTANPNWAGYTSGNRIAANDTEVFQASSGVPHNTLVSGATSGGTRPVNSIFVFAQDGNGVAASFSKHRLSFVAIHEGLTSAQSATFYGLVQARRTALGGGAV